MEKDIALCKYQQLIYNKINVFGFLLLTKLYYSLFTSILPAASISKNVCTAQMHCKDEHKLFKSLIIIYMSRTRRHWSSRSCTNQTKIVTSLIAGNTEKWTKQYSVENFKHQIFYLYFYGIVLKCCLFRIHMKTCMHSVTARQFASCCIFYSWAWAQSTWRKQAAFLQRCRQTAEYWAQRKGAEVMGLERVYAVVCSEQDTGADLTQLQDCVPCCQFSI